MRKHPFILVFFLKITFVFSQNTFVEFNPPHLIWLNDKERKALSNNQSSEAKFFKKEILENAKRHLKENPNPIDSIFYEGFMSNNPKRIESSAHLKDLKSIYYLNWAYIFTQNHIYAQKTKAFLLSWAKTYQPTGNDVNENKLAICFYAYETVKSVLSDDENEVIEKWLDKIAKKQIENWNPNSGSSNRHVKRAKLILLGGIALENSKFKDFALQKIDTLLNYAILPDGKTQDLIRRDAMHYHVDCLITFMEVNYLTKLLDIDLFHKKSLKNASISNCLEFLKPYFRGEKIHKEWINTTVGLDKKRWKSGDEFYKPGKIWDPSEGIPLLILTKKYDKAIENIFETKFKNQVSEEDKFTDWLLSFKK